MKKALLTLAALAMATSAYAQGIITFYNNNLTGPNGTYVAGIWADNAPLVFGDTKGDSTVGGGTTPGGVTVGLFRAGQLTTPIATTTLRTGTRPEVFAATQDINVPGVAPGQVANLVIRAWSSTEASYDAVVAKQGSVAGLVFGEQAFTTRALGGPNPDPTSPSFPQPDMGPGFLGFELETTTIVPEPSTIALGALGIGALLLRRRK